MINSSLPAIVLVAAATAQVPTFEVDQIDVGIYGSDAVVYDFGSISAGADSGWVASAEISGAGAPNSLVFVGRLGSDDPLGARVLRAPAAVGGQVQTRIQGPTLGGGKIAYVGFYSSDGLSTGAVWLEDQIVAAPGDAAGSDGATWLSLLAGQATATGEVIVSGSALLNGVAIERFVRYPGNQVLLSEGQPIQGTTETVGEISMTSIASNGEHSLAIARMWPSGRNAVIVDGAVHESRGGSLAIQGEPLGGFAAGVLDSTRRWSSWPWAAVNGVGDVAVLGIHVGAASSDADYFRDGSLVHDLSNNAINDSPIGIDERGFLFRAAHLDPVGFAGVEDIPTSSGPPYVDLDQDGTADFGIVAYSNGGSMTSSVLTGSGDAYSAAFVGQGSSRIARTVLEHVQIVGNRVICDAERNSAGRGARLHAIGSDLAANNRLRLTAIGLARSSFTLPLFSASVTALPGNSGGLCLATPVGRANYLLTQSWFDGSATFDVLLNVIPQPGGSVATMPGQTWYAQLWYRDNVSGTSSSRFSDAIELSFR